MSASLVGSEMCIRDSARPPRSAPRAAGPSDPPRRPFPPWGLGDAPVSYTHVMLPTICSVQIS
eukprot:7573006-Alexandrium_andersonii.AAC.1